MTLELLHDREVIDTWVRKIGLRTIELDRHPDEFGESFQFVVNERHIFAKGANWNPAHSFVTEVGAALHDGVEPRNARIEWELCHLTTGRIRGGRKNVAPKI